MTPDLLDKEIVSGSAGEDDVSRFLQEIRRYPRLTPEEERELARRCAEGDEDAIRRMVNSNLRLVVSVAREYAGRGVPLLDLIQEGSIGLLVAARKFDYTLDFRFSTYATKWIRQGVTRCLMNHAGLIRVPVHTAERMRKVEATRAALRQEEGEEPTPARIAEKCGISEEKVRELIALMPDVFSLDIPTGEGDEGSLHSLLALICCNNLLQFNNFFLHFLNFFILLFYLIVHKCFYYRSLSKSHIIKLTWSYMMIAKKEIHCLYLPIRFN